MNTIKRWKKIAKKIAIAEGVSHVRFYPINKPFFYEEGEEDEEFVGMYRYRKICTISFCIKPYRNYRPIGNLIHEIAHSIDHLKRDNPLHDKTFNRILNRLSRKYIWNKK